MKTRTCMQTIHTAVLVTGLTVLSLAGNAVGMTNAKPTPDADERFYIYKDSLENNWSTAGWMPENAGSMISTFDRKCPDNPRSGKSCIRVKIGQWDPPNWCGVAFAIENPGNPDKGYFGLTEANGWDLRGAKRLVFSVRSPDECRVQFQTCTTWDKPYGDSTKKSFETEFIKLGPEWREYSIDLDGVDLSRIVTGFCFVTSQQRQSKSRLPIEFYLDDIYWQFESNPTEPPTGQTPATDAADGRFWVYQDKNMNDWVPANWMPGNAKKMIALFEPSSTVDPKEGENCIHVTIGNWADPYWCGIAWAIVNPSNPDDPYWGETPAAGWDLSGAKRVVFWARAPKPCKVQFEVCSSRGKPFGDSVEFAPKTEFIALTPEWKEYAIDLGSVDLKRVVTAFCWVSKRDGQADPNEPVDFYLDSIYWETTRQPERK